MREASPKKRKGCLIAMAIGLGLAALFVFGIVEALTPRDVSKEPPEKVFREFVCTPMPASVRDLEVHGGIAFAGGNVMIDFAIDEGDRQALVSRGRFISVESPGKDIDGRWMEKYDPFTDQGGASRYVRDPNEMTLNGLFLAKRGNRARYQHIEF